MRQGEWKIHMVDIDNTFQLVCQSGTIQRKERVSVAGVKGYL